MLRYFDHISATPMKAFINGTCLSSPTCTCTCIYTKILHIVHVLNVGNTGVEECETVYPPNGMQAI